MLHSATQYTYINKAFFTLKISYVVTVHLYMQFCLPSPLPCPAPIVTKFTKAQQQQHVKTTRTKYHTKCTVNVESADRFVDGLV
jgi:hypothetical protein